MENVDVDVLYVRIDGLNGPVDSKVLVEREEDQSGFLVECEGADIIVHCGVRGEADEGEDGDGVVGVLLGEVVEGVNNVVGLGDEVGALVAFVGGKDGGCTADEVGEVEDVNADGRGGGGVGGFE